MLTALFFAATLLKMPLKQEATYDLVWRPQTGTQMAYKLTLSIESQPDPFVFSAKLNSKVIRIKPNGDYDVQSAITDGKVKHGLHVEPMDDGSKPTIDTYNKRGEKIASTEEDSSADESNPALNSLDAITDQLTPKSAVHIGESWTTSLQPNKKLSREAGKVTYTLLDQSKQGNYKVLKIGFKYTETEKDQPLTSDGYVMLNIQDFSLVRFEGVMKGAKFSSDPDFPKGDATLSIVRD